MKKILLCLLALAAGLTAFGQNESSFGVRAGLNVANLHLSAGGLSASLDSRASYHVGFAYQQPVLRMSSSISKRDFTSPDAGRR